MRQKGYATIARGGERVSVLIRNVEMPDGCDGCAFISGCKECSTYNNFCMAEAFVVGNHHFWEVHLFPLSEPLPAARPEWCPLEEV